MATTLEAVPGKALVFDLTVADANGPRDLVEGTKLWFTAKRDYASSDALADVQCELGNGIEIVDAEKGEAQVVVPASMTSDFEVGDVFAFDVQYEATNGMPFQIDYGYLKVVPVVTNAL